MKTRLLLIVFIIATNFTIFAQNIKLNKSELEATLCKQWEIEYALMGEMRIGQLPGAADFDFNFHPNGKYDIINDEGNTKSGLWKYSTENKYVELSVDQKITSRIKYIDKNKLILILVSGQNDPPGLPSMEVHFKPM